MNWQGGGVLPVRGTCTPPPAPQRPSLKGAIRHPLPSEAVLTSASHLGWQPLEVPRGKNTQVPLPLHPQLPSLPHRCLQGPAGPRETDAMGRVIGHSTLPAHLPSRPSVCGAGPLPRG